MRNILGIITGILLVLFAIGKHLNLCIISEASADTVAEVNAQRVSADSTDVTAVASDVNRDRATHTSPEAKAWTTDGTSTKANASATTGTSYNMNAQVGTVGNRRGRKTATIATGNVARRINTLFHELTGAIRRVGASVRDVSVGVSHKISVAIQLVRTNPVAQVNANGTIKMGATSNAGTTFPGIGPALRWADAAIHSASDSATRKVTAAIHQIRVASAKPSTRLAVQRAMSSTSTGGGGGGTSAGTGTATATGGASPVRKVDTHDVAGTGDVGPGRDAGTSTQVPRRGASTSTEGSKEPGRPPGAAIEVGASATAKSGNDVKTGDSAIAATPTGVATNTRRDASDTATSSTDDTGRRSPTPASSSASTIPEHKGTSVAGNAAVPATDRASSAPGNGTKPASRPGAHPGAVANVDTGLAANASIVFEAFDVRRPEVAEMAIGGLRYELDKLGYISTPRDVRSQLGSQLALPARANPQLTAQGLLAELETAHNQYSGATEFGKLVSVLSQAVTRAMENPALVVTDQTIRDNLQNALLDLALVDGKLAREPARVAEAARLQLASEDMMAEWIRTFSGAEITQKKNGPEAEKLYLRVRTERERAGRGGLEVKIDDPNVQLYVNEEFRASQRLFMDLAPGRYRVLLMGPNDDGRLFLADVAPNQLTHLDVQWTISSNLVVSPSTAGFVFASTTHPEASMLACKLAGATGRGNDAVVLLGMESVDEQWRVTAALYGTRDCQLLRRGYVKSEQPTAEENRALARFIARGERTKGVEIAYEADPAVFQRLMSDRMSRTATPIAPVETPEQAPWLAWAELGGAAALVATGGYAFHVDVKPLGYGALGLGIALGALAMYSFAHDEKPSSAAHVTIAPLRAGAALGWAASF